MRDSTYKMQIIYMRDNTYKRQIIYMRDNTLAVSLESFPTILVFQVLKGIGTESVFVSFEALQGPNYIAFLIKKPRHIINISNN